MAGEAGEEADRDRVVGRVVAALGARSGTDQRPPVAPAVLVRGAWGAGTSWVLRAVAGRLRSRRVPTTITVGDGRPGRVDDALGAVGRRRGEGVVVVDDAHRLADADADVVRDAVLNRFQRVLLGARVPEPLPEALGWLVASGALEVVELDPLDDRATASIMEALAGGRIHAGTVHRANRLAAGRPGFVVDLTNAGVAAGQIVRRNGLWRLTGRLPLELVARRLGFEHRLLPGAVAEAHRILAIAGPVPEGVARELVGAGPVDHLVATGHLLVAGGRVEVDPPAVAAAVRASGSLTEEHARQLLRLDPAAAPDLLVERRLAAGEVPGDDAIEEAARARWVAGDPHHALSLIRRSAGGPSALRLEADLLADLGERLEALSVLERLEVVADPRLREAAAGERATITMWMGQRERALSISRAALDAEDASPAAAIAHALLALEGGDPAGAAEVAQVLLADEATAGAATSILATAAALQGEGTRAVALADEACGLLGGPMVAPDVATITLVLALSENGELARAGQVADDGYRRALGAGRSAQAWMALCRLRVALGTGDLLDAAAYGLEAAELFADLDHHAALRWALAGRLQAAAALGDAGTVDTLDRDLDELGSSGVQFLEPDVLRARGWARVLAGDPVGARRWIEGAADLAVASGSWSLAAAARHELVRIGAAPAAVDGLRALAGRVDSHWMAPRLDHAAGVAEPDAERVLAAAAGFRQLGALLHAREAASDAAAVARAAGDRAAERRANAELHRLPPHPHARTPSLVHDRARDHELTEREREVAELAASGDANQEIASALAISVRTVENLLHRAYHKLGIAGRAELAERFSPVDRG